MTEQIVAKISKHNFICHTYITNNNCVTSWWFKHYILIRNCLKCYMYISCPIWFSPNRLYPRPQSIRILFSSNGPHDVYLRMGNTSVLTISHLPTRAKWISSFSISFQEWTLINSSKALLPVLSNQHYLKKIFYVPDTENNLNILRS